MLPNLFRTGDSLLNRNGNLDAEAVCHGFGLLHDRPDEAADGRVASHLRESRPGEGTERIKGHVAEQLDPDFVADADGHRAAQAGVNESLSDGAAAVRARPVGLSE